MHPENNNIGRDSNPEMISKCLTYFNIAITFLEGHFFKDTLFSLDNNYFYEIFFIRSTYPFKVVARMKLFGPFFFDGMDNQPSETRHRRKKMGRKRGGGESDEAFCK
jgi:hypothetical protein